MEPRRRFRFLKELSEGAFGKVYMAEMITGDNFRSIVAIKLLHGKWLAHEEIVQRSRDEARVLGLLHHRNIIRVEDLTSINGQCAIVMEYLDGVDLKTLINYTREQGTRVPRKVAFEVIAAVASALEAAYNQAPLQGGEPLRLIHRDIKPSNVMITKAGDVKVLDFGTAQARFDEREAHTQALAFGSAAYMAPERLLGDPDAPSGDVFSLGVTLYELLAGKGFGKIHIRPEKYEAALIERTDSLDLSDLGPERSAQVRQVLRLMLSYEPEDRPTARQVVDLMEALADEVHDGSMRRFARTVVTPCRDMLEPVVDDNDPLTGSTLFEDRTGPGQVGDTGEFSVAAPDDVDAPGPVGGRTWIDDPENPFQVPPELDASIDEVVDDSAEPTAPPGAEVSGHVAATPPATDASGPKARDAAAGRSGPRLADPRSDATPPVDRSTGPRTATSPSGAGAPQPGHA
ncbi:MAG: serine/threonine protein kinase, partial [Deltaproteobacteria bacterium]